MRDRLDEAVKAIAQMNEFGTDFKFTAAIEAIERRIDRLQENGANRHLRQIRKIITRLMQRVNKVATRKELWDNDDFKEAYNVFSDNFYRRNQHISVYCYALWAQLKLVLKRTVFERRVLNRGLAKKYQRALPEEQATKFVELIDLLKTGETENAEQHKPEQTKQVKEYIQLCRNSFKFFLIEERKAQREEEEYRIDPYHFYRYYCGNMKEWNRYLFLASI